jgi:site-specific DNA-methyltransferase (adenine-specific)
MKLPDWWIKEWGDQQPYAITDCLEAMKKIPDKSVDLILTDPPYGIQIDKMGFVTSGPIKVGGAYRNDYRGTNWDSKRISVEMINEMLRISKNQIIFGGEHYTDILAPTRCWILWDKRCCEKNSNDFADGEMAWTSFDKPTRVFRYLWYGMLQDNMLKKEERVHPTQKPVSLFAWILENFSKPTDIILDPFLGSGTTLIACRKTNRVGMGFEINSEYESVIRKRYMADIPNIETFESEEVKI